MQQVTFVPGRGGISLTATSNSWETYVAKYDLNGNVAWAKKIGGNPTYSYDLTVDNSQNVYVTGSFQNSIDFGSGITLNSATGAFYAKYNTSGNALWAKKIDGEGQTYGIELDNSNNIYLAGNFTSPTLTFGSIALSNSGSTDAFFGKFDNVGNPVWVKKIGETGQDAINTLKLDTFGNIYVGGSFTGTTGFGSIGYSGISLVAGAVGDGFFAKYDNNANIQYVKQIGLNNNKYDGVHTLAVDNIGNILVGGLFSGTSYFSSTSTLTTTNGDTDIFMAKYWQTPEINVKRDYANYVPGAIIDFYNGLVANNNTPITFTIENLGGSDLNIAIASNSPDFVVNSTISFIAPYSSATFTVAFNPTSLGTKNAEISITNNDPNENPYIIKVRGTGVSPEINVKNILDINGGFIDIPNNTTLNMGNLKLVGNEFKSSRIQIENIGTGILTNISVEVIGADAGDFELQSIPNSTINMGSSTSFNIKFRPSKMGLHTAQLKITNSDIDENPYIINLTGIGLTPDINLKQGSINIASGGNIVLPSVLAGELSETIITIENSGNDNLTILPNSYGWYIEKVSNINSPIGAGSFSSTTIPVGGTATFKVSFRADTYNGTGTYTSSFRMYSNDWDEQIYTFNVSATVIEPEINVREGNTNIPHQTVFDMGTITEAGFGGVYNGPIQKTLIIENIGLGHLYCPNYTTITPVMYGTEPNTFTTTQPSFYIASGQNTSIIVTFTPTYTLTSATFRAVLEIKNNDSDENPYRIILEGKWQTLQGLDPNMLNIYPNPSPNGIFNADFTSNLEEQFLVEILNQQLNIVQSGVFIKPIGTYSFSMNISNQPSGIYTMRLTSSQGRITKQIIKQ